MKHTRAAVEAWVEKLFVSDKQIKQSRGLMQRASTGSLPLSSALGGGAADPKEK